MPSPDTPGGGVDGRLDENTVGSDSGVASVVDANDDDAIMPQRKVRTMLILRRYAENVTAHPGESKYRKLKLTNPTFAAVVWCNEEAKMLLLQNGWRTDLRQGWLVLDSSHVTGAALAEAVDAVTAASAASAATLSSTTLPSLPPPQAQQQQQQQARPEAEAEAEAEANDNGLEVGCRVVIYGLQKRRELNGAEGIVDAEVRDEGRWRVKVVVWGEEKVCLLKSSCMALLATAADEAVASLITTIPPAVQHWLDGGDVGNVIKKRRLAREASEWLVKVVENAHLSPQLKKAGRDLMARRDFTGNLEANQCWNQIMQELKAILVGHGKMAKEANAACNLAAELTEEAILKIASFNTTLIPSAASTGGGGDISGGGGAAPITAAHHQRPRNDVRQDELMQSATASISTNFKRDWKQQPENVYIHMLQLIGVVLDPLFGDELDQITWYMDGVEAHDAPIKSFVRMRNKLRSRDDHQQVKQRPRPAMNIDIVRRLVSAKTPEDVRELVKLVSERFGGLSYLKCLPELAVTDPDAADARFHMLPVMVTVVFAPEGLTVGDLLADSEVRAKWAKIRAARPADDVSLEQWQADHDAAVEALVMRCDPTEPVKMHCEVQVVTEAMGDTRHKMHEVYKVYRAENGDQLYADVAKPTVERDIRDLIVAAQKGRIATVKGLLDGSGVGGLEWNGMFLQNSGGGGGGGAGVDVNRQERWLGGATALYCAAEAGHLSVVLVLLEHNANPNITMTANGATPMVAAAQNGHVEVAALLLEHNADPNKATTDDGSTPMFMAAQGGHVDVAALLLKHNADPNKATTDDGASPMYMAAQNGHVEVIAILLKHSIDPNMVTNRGNTPLSVATHKGHTAAADMLRAAGAT